MTWCPKEIIVYLEDFTFETIDMVWGKLREELLKKSCFWKKLDT
jgi:hypothetical protein